MHSRSVDGADRLQLRPPALPPRAAPKTALHFHYASHGFPAPFDSQDCWTPRSVLRDGSKNSGSPFAPLIGRFSVRRRPLVKARASLPLMRASQPNQPLTASPARSFGLRHAHRVDCQPGSYPVHAHPVQPCRRQPIYRARPFQSVHMGLLSRIAARVRQSIWPQPTASEAITRDTSTKRWKRRATCLRGHLLTPLRLVLVFNERGHEYSAGATSILGQIPKRRSRRVHSAARYTHREPPICTARKERQLSYG